MATFHEIGRAVIENIETVIIGKRAQIMTVLAAMLADGHVLLEDVPGVAKTMLARSLAISLGCEFKRIQCTPDLLPTDVTGVSVFNQRDQRFDFVKGPVFTHVLLADEVNRATPRAQSALLEAMEERQVSVDGVTNPLPRPFFLIATQNPVEQEGTFPLPEAQLDRFLVRLSMGYPEFHEELDMLERLGQRHPIESLRAVADAKALVQMQQFVRKVFVHRVVKEYILRLVHATRESLKLGLGASPRASISMMRASQALAALNERDYVTPDDVKALAAPVLSHRVIVKPEYRLRKEDARSVILGILKEVEAPSSLSARPAAGGAVTAGNAAGPPGKAPSPRSAGGEDGVPKGDVPKGDAPKMGLIDL